MSSNATSPKALFPSHTSFPTLLLFTQFALRYSKTPFDTITTQKVIYNQDVPLACKFLGLQVFPVILSFINSFLERKIDQWLLVMSTELIGFSIGGICKRCLVAPPSRIWPDNLVTAALINTLHTREILGTRARSGISHERFSYVFISYILYGQFFSPGKLAVALI